MKRLGRKAHYALGLKANRGRLFACAEASFPAADTAADLVFHETRKAGHGRLEIRRASVLPLKALKQPPAFRGSRRSAASRPPVRAPAAWR